MQISQLIEKATELSAYDGQSKSVFADVVILGIVMRVLVTDIDRGSNGEIILILDTTTWP